MRIDCGTQALLDVASHHGVAASKWKIWARTPPRNGRLSLGALACAARELGFDARPVRGAQAHLDTLPLPAIAHLRREHWVVITAVDDDAVEVCDEGQPGVRLDRDAFLGDWSGYALVVTPGTRTASA